MDVGVPEAVRLGKLDLGEPDSPANIAGNVAVFTEEPEAAVEVLNLMGQRGFAVPEGQGQQLEALAGFAPLHDRQLLVAALALGTEGAPAETTSVGSDAELLGLDVPDEKAVRAAGIESRKLVGLPLIPQVGIELSSSEPLLRI